jgi:hypothetical protein
LPTSGDQRAHFVDGALGVGHSSSGVAKGGGAPITVTREGAAGGFARNEYGRVGTRKAWIVRHFWVVIRPRRHRT